MNTSNLERTISEIDRDAPAPSPFLPGTNIQFAWDSTSLGLLKTCPRLYQYTMIDGWGSNDESIHLRFGIEYHSTLEDYDRYRAEGLGHDDALRESLRNLLCRIHGWQVDRDTRAGKYKNPATIIALTIDYLDKYSDDPAETYILADGRPAVELSFRFELDWGPRQSRTIEIAQADGSVITGVEEFDGQPYILSGHLDRVVSFQDSLFVMDRKTSLSTLSAHYFSQYEPNNQMTLYSLAAKVILASPIKGVIIDGAQVKLEENHTFQRGFTYRTEDQLDEWVNDLRLWLGMAEQYALANYWPMNDTACDKFGGCRFRSICSKSPQVRERFLASNFTKLAPEERWNPLKPR